MMRRRWHLLLLKLPLLELVQELLVILDLIVDMFLAAGVLLATEWGRVLQVDTTVLTVEIWHFLFN